MPLHQSLPDDSIVFPNQYGASHLHDFFGNTTTDANSTYESLRSGGTTCNRAADTAAYWFPAVLQDGAVVKPGVMAVYYQSSGKNPSTIQAHPANLRVIAVTGGGAPYPRVCPQLHPVSVPQLRIGVTYPTTGGPGTSLSSGSALTAHGDYINAWDQSALEESVSRCIKGSGVGLLCSPGFE